MQLVWSTNTPQLVLFFYYSISVPILFHSIDKIYIFARFLSSNSFLALPISRNPSNLAYSSYALTLQAGNLSDFRNTVHLVQIKSSQGTDFFLFISKVRLPSLFFFIIILSVFLVHSLPKPRLSVSYLPGLRASFFSFFHSVNPCPRFISLRRWLLALLAQPNISFNCFMGQTLRALFFLPRHPPFLHAFVIWHIEKEHGLKKKKKIDKIHIYISYLLRPFSLLLNFENYRKKKYHFFFQNKNTYFDQKKKKKMSCYWNNLNFIKRK